MTEKSRTRIRVIADDQDDEPVKRGRGRPKGSTNKLSQAAVAAARETGEMPHEFLLRIARGEVIETKVRSPETGEVRSVFQVPDLPMRVDAANKAAPYYAPKLSAVQWMQKADDNELDELIARLASQAGVDIGSSGEGQADSSQDTGPGPTD